MSEVTYKLRTRRHAKYSYTAYVIRIDNTFVLQHYGFGPGKRFVIHVNESSFDLILDDKGTHKVSEARHPIININVPKEMPWLGEATHVVAKFEQGTINIRRAEP